jgi:hypothetical protein
MPIFRKYQTISLLLMASVQATAVFAKTIEKPAAQNSEPLPKGYDESFQTGDIPKPTAPDLDPDNLGEDGLNPDQLPEMNPMNDPALDNEPRNYRLGLSASLSLPHMLNFALESMIGSNFSVSVNYGNVTRSLNNVDVSLKHQDIRLRWFPYSTSFFVGLGLGQHQLTGELDRTIKVSAESNAVSAPVNGKLKASATYAVPHVGWFSIWDSGFVVGFDVGYLLPANSKSTFSHTFKNAPAGSETALTESADFKKLKSDLEDSAKKHASRPTPFTSLLRLGWMF